MAKATIEQIRETVLDGWRLGCGCLHLQVAKECGGSSYINAVTTATDPTKCDRYHGRNT